MMFLRIPQCTGNCGFTQPWPVCDCELNQEVPLQTVIDFLFFQKVWLTWTLAYILHDDLIHVFVNNNDSFNL